MILYHYTARFHLPAIFEAGALTRTESNIGSGNPRLKPYGEHLGPDVVWLTDVADLKRGHGLVGGILNKLAICFTVQCDAVHWPKFAAQHGINKRWYRCLNDGSANHWWVCLKDIPSIAWIEVADREQNRMLTFNEEAA